MTNLFTYGSLMCADIMLHVSGQSTSHQNGILYDYFRSQIHSETYPAIIAQPGQQVEGVVYFNLDSAAINKLDTFEGEYYTREDITINCSHMEQVNAMAYILKPEYKTILTGTFWSFENFLQSGKEEFLTNYVGFDKI